MSAKHAKLALSCLLSPTGSNQPRPDLEFTFLTSQISPPGIFIQSFSVTSLTCKLAAYAIYTKYPVMSEVACDQVVLLSFFGGRRKKKRVIEGCVRGQIRSNNPRQEPITACDQTFWGVRKSADGQKRKKDRLIAG